MAKRRNTTNKKHETGKSITTKSWFGSHAEMVIEELEGGKVKCEDEKGYYVTEKNRIDNGLADPNRYSSKRGI